MSRRADLDVKAAQALQIVNNPLFDSTFNKLREETIGKLERLGEPGENIVQAINLVQQLQAAKNFKAAFIGIIAKNDRKMAQAERNEKDEKPFDPTELKPNLEVT